MTRLVTITGATMTDETANDAFANRLRKNRKNLAKWLTRENVSCFRLYDADIPEFALAVDIYQDINHAVYAHVQEYEAPKSVDPAKAQERLDHAVSSIKNVLEIDAAHLYLKVRRQQKGANQYEKIASAKQFIQVQENGNLFYVNLADYLDTGLFLDHRNTRRLLTTYMQTFSGQGAFLNLFSYTGSATVYAAKGGARKTTTIDMSNTYIEWAQRNMQANGFSGPEHEFIQADCLQWLASPYHKDKYDVIFLDPPSFSTSKRMTQTFDVQRDHVTLIRHCLRLLKPQGIFVFSNNLRRFKLDNDQLTDLNIESLHHLTLPKDFERNPKIHNCWKITRR